MEVGWQICFKGRTTLPRTLHSNGNNGGAPPSLKTEPLPCHAYAGFFATTNDRQLRSIDRPTDRPIGIRPTPSSMVLYQISVI